MKPVPPESVPAAFQYPVNIILLRSQGFYESFGAELTDSSLPGYFFAKNMVNAIPAEKRTALAASVAENERVMNIADSAFVIRVAGTSSVATNVAGAYFKAPY